MSASRVWMPWWFWPKTIKQRRYTKYVWMRHVTHMNASCHVYWWVMSHIRMRHVTYMNESRHTYECRDGRVQIASKHGVMSHVRMTLFRTCDVSYVRHDPLFENNQDTQVRTQNMYDWGASHKFLQKRPIISGSFAENHLQLEASYACSPPYNLGPAWLWRSHVSHIWMSYVTHMIEARHTSNWGIGVHVTYMMESCHDSFICMICLIHIQLSPPTNSRCVCECMSYERVVHVTYMKDSCHLYACVM